MKFPCATRLVCAFQYKSDAEAFYGSLCDRLGKFGLSVAEDKTRILRFCRFDLAGSGRFDFLGFEFFWARTRCGFRGVRRRTSRKKLRASLATFSAWIRSTRHRRLSVIVPILKAKYRGYWNYYGVVGNSASAWLSSSTGASASCSSGLIVAASDAATLGLDSRLCWIRRVYRSKDTVNSPASPLVILLLVRRAVLRSPVR